MKQELSAFQHRLIMLKPHPSVGCSPPSLQKEEREAGDGVIAVATYRKPKIPKQIVDVMSSCSPWIRLHEIV